MADQPPEKSRTETFGFEPADEPVLDPAAIPGYEILGVLGQGGMSVVYEAFQASLGRHVALKRLRHGVQARHGLLDRFRREVRALAQLHDPHIVPIYDVGEHQGIPYFTMELISGGSLAGNLRGPPWRRTPRRG